GESRADLLANLRTPECGQRSNRRDRRKEVRIRDRVLLLADAVLPQRRHRIRQRETIEKDAGAGANDGLWTHGPRDSDARTEIVRVVNVGLILVTQAGTQRQILSYFPVVSDEKADIEFTGRQARIARSNAELRGATTPIGDL